MTQTQTIDEATQTEQDETTAADFGLQGTAVVVRGITATVVPIAWRDMKRFSKQLIAIVRIVIDAFVQNQSGAIRKLSELPMPEDIDDPDERKLVEDQRTEIEHQMTERAFDIIAQSLPPILIESMDIVEACVVMPDKCPIKMDDLAHYEIPPLIEAFVSENFGVGKLEGWVMAVTSMTKKNAKAVQNVKRLANHTIASVTGSRP